MPRDVDWRNSPRRDATDAEARALASALRMRILRACLDEPRTNKEIAALLGRDPATTLHHVRRLVDTGFLAPTAPRRGRRGAREIPYEATGKSWRISTPAADRVLLDAFLEEVALVPLETIETVRFGLRLTEERQREFLDRFVELLDDYDDDRDGRPLSLFLALHPDPNRS